MSAFDQALAADDRGAVIDRAHKLAGIAGMFGHHDVGDAALALEDAARDGAALEPAAQPLRHLLAALAAS